MKIYQLLRIPKDRDNIVFSDMWYEGDPTENTVTVCVSLDGYTTENYSPIMCTSLSAVEIQLKNMIEQHGEKWDYEIMEVDIPEELL